MGAFEVISRRRSIRKYRQGEIGDDKIEALLRCAMYAPSAINEQPWHFIVVKDKDSLRELSEILAYGKMLSEAAAAIVICADKKLCKTNEDFWVQDCSAATQNILLDSFVDDCQTNSLTTPLPSDYTHDDICE